MKPGIPKAVYLKDSRNLTRITETIESTNAPETVEFVLTPIWMMTNKIDEAPFYVQIATPEGRTGTQYTLTLRELATGKIVFKNQKSTVGRYASIKIGCKIKKVSHVLTVTCSTPSTIQNLFYMFWRKIFHPRFTLFVGPHRIQQVDVQL